MEKKRFFNIDFLRFIFAIIIILYHFCHAGKGSFFLGTFKNISEVANFSSMTSFGNLAVDFFFIIAGFFLFYRRDFGIKISDFVKSRIIRLYPLVLLYSIISILFGFFVYKINNYIPYEQILRLLLIDNIGLNLVHSGITWYVSVLFWCSLFYFYIIKYFEKKYIDLFIPLIIIFCYSFLIHAYKGNITGHTQSFDFIYNAGVLRGLAGLGLGIIIAKIYSELGDLNNKISFYSKIIYSIAEGVLLYFVINFTCLKKLSYYSNFIIIVAFAILFFLFLLNKGYISNLLNNRFLGYLGRYTYSIFIIHRFVQNTIKIYVLPINTNFVSNHIYITIFLVTLLCIIAGIITYYLIEKPSFNYLKKYEKQTKKINNYN